MAIRPMTITLVSETEFLMDRDNITYAEQVTRWHKDPINKDQQQPGDDRVPAWGWLGRLHYSEATGLVGIPEGMLSPCIRAAGVMVPHPTAKHGKTLKEASQSGILFRETSFPLLLQRPGVPGVWQPIDYNELYEKLGQEDDFAVHEAVVKLYGFRLDVRRAKPQLGRHHIRVRPMFGTWRCVCNLNLTDDNLSDTLALQLFRLAGHHKGIGNWRPSAGKAGSYGMFSVEEGIPGDLQP